MTDPNHDSQQYWQIKAPKTKFPEPKFHYGLQARKHWHDEQGNYHYEIGEIIGMQCESTGNYANQWSYRLHLLWSNCCPWRIGLDEDDFEPESSLVADETDLSAID